MGVVLIAPLALCYALVSGDWLTAFWVAFPVLPLVGFAALFPVMRWSWVLYGYVAIALLEGIVDPFASLGSGINSLTGLGADPRATGLGGFGVLITILLVCVFVSTRRFAALIAAIGVGALVCVLTLFHLVTISQPFSAARGALEAQTPKWLAQDCEEGCVQGSAQEIIDSFPDLERLAWTIDELRDVERVQVCWIESDILLRSPAVDVCLSKQAAVWEARVRPSGVDVYIPTMRQGFALLSLAFMSAWGFGVAYIIRRHGPMRYRQGRWVRPS